MDKVKKSFWKCIDFIYKHKVISFFVAFSIATSFILFNVFANDDQYENRLVVNNITITSIEDGQAIADHEEGDGKDASTSNGILRNYDSITYNGTYTLELKEGTTTDTVENRIVLVDVILPKTIDAKLWSNSQSGSDAIDSQNLDQNYVYYEFEMNQITLSNSTNPSLFSFQLIGVNTKTPGETFTPIVLMKESTDANFKAISEMTDVEKEALISNLPTNKAACDSNTVHCTTTITGIYDFDVVFMQGAYPESQSTITNKKYPIGIGIKVASYPLGKYIPNKVSFTLGKQSDEGITVDYVENSFVNYKTNPEQNYVIRHDTVNELPNINNNVTYNPETGVVTIDNIMYSDSNDLFIGTGAFEISSTRLSQTDSSNKNITFTSSNIIAGENTLIKESSGSLVVTDYYQKFVGSFGSRIKVKPMPLESLLEYSDAYLNYNQVFSIEEEIAYASDGVGDELDELNTYIKFDPTAFTVSKEGNTISDSNAILKYAHGQWTGDYFELTNETGCPTNFSSLSTENLMNLYGGPCLRAKESLVWTSSSEENDLPIIIVDAVFGDKDNDEFNVQKALSATIKINGKINNDINLINTSHQISSSSTGMFNGTLYYMSNTINTNDVASAKNKDNYIKGSYDFNEHTVTDGVQLCGSNSFCHISGKTIHINGFAVNSPEVHAYFNDYERTSFYDYPIEWRIDSNVSSDDDSIEYDSAEVTVIIPNTLDYLYAETIVNGVRTSKNPTSVEDIDDFLLSGPAKEYHFTFNENEISSGAINTLSIFTDIFLSTKSETYVDVYAYSNFSGYKVDGTNIIRLSDERPLLFRLGGRDVILYNGGAITTYGNANPRFIEKDQSYTYTMKSYNNSSNDNNSGYAYLNATMYYMLPYIEDSNYKTYKKKFSNTSYKIKLMEKKEGYTVYYTTDSSTNVINDIYKNTNPDSNINWKAWDNPTKEVEATAIKIVKDGHWDMDSYFYSENGVIAEITPIKNKPADAYYNGFIMTVNRPSGFVPECDPEHEDCSNYTFSDRLYYQSSKSLVEVYSRQISGFVFEDYNYSNIYENGEDQLENIVVELYKLNNENYTTNSDATNPNQFINPSVDTKVAETTTDAYGKYSFTGLSEGNYYVLFRYDGEKYTPSEKYGGLLTGISNADQINCKAVGRNQVENEAISDILTLAKEESSNIRYINLGLRIRKEFGVEINKYITQIIQTSNQGSKTYEYDKATKVNIDIKNLKNTKFRVTYSFDIVNTKYFPGYIGVIADLMPAGMTFDSSIPENADWALYDGILYYTGLQDKLLLPGDKQYFQLVLDLDTNTGGTYLNIVAAQQPILMGDEMTQYDFSAITVDAESNNSQEGEENTTPDSGQTTNPDTGGNSNEGNGGGN